MQLDPLGIRLAEKIIAASGDRGRAVRVGALAAPVEDWSSGDLLKLAQRLRAETDDEFWGLAAHRCAPSAFETYMVVATRCSTLREALLLGSRVIGLATEAVKPRLVETEDRAILEMHREWSPRDPDEAVTDWCLIMYYRAVQWLIGVEIPFDVLEFNHPLDAPYSVYSAMFGVTCSFNGEVARLVFPREFLNRRIVRRAMEADELSQDIHARFLAPLALATTWKQRVRNILRANIGAGEPPPSIEEIAADLAMSSQTLRRRLRDERSSYRQLKAEARREIAIAVLADEGATISDASIAAGFAEPNALTRALRNGDGISSTDLRQVVRGWTGEDRPRRAAR